jgi:hypothetical protein
MSDDGFVESELAKATKRVEALPQWRRAVLERARAAEAELGYVRPHAVPLGDQPQDLGVRSSQEAK